MTRKLTAFVGERKIISGTEQEVRIALRLMGDEARSALLFDDGNGRQVDIDLREGADLRPSTISAPDGMPEGRGRGRPSLGVKAREVTLLPRHWDWLAAQPGGASVTLRKLVETASKAENSVAARRSAMDAACTFAMAMAGDRPGYEDATRALYAGDGPAFVAAIAHWPADIKGHMHMLSAPAFAQE